MWKCYLKFSHHRENVMSNFSHHCENFISLIPLKISCLVSVRHHFIFSIFISFSTSSYVECEIFLHECGNIPVYPFWDSNPGNIFTSPWNIPLTFAFSFSLTFYFGVIVNRRSVQPRKSEFRKTIHIMCVLNSEGNVILGTAGKRGSFWLKFIFVAGPSWIFYFPGGK